MADLSIFSEIIQDFTPGAAGVWTGVFMFFAWWIREWRETRKLSSSDRLARRDGYARQVESLMAENRLLREDLRKLERQHHEYRRQCVAENDDLRKELCLTKGQLEEIKASLNIVGKTHKDGRAGMFIAGGKTI